MTRKPYTMSDDTVHYKTRDELLARAERAEAAEAERDELRGRIYAFLDAA